MLNFSSLERGEEKIAESLGYHPGMILAGRRINDGMGKYVAEMVVKLLIQAEKQVRGAKVAVLGLTFKEDVPDIRNTKVVDILKELGDYGVGAVVHDPVAGRDEALEETAYQLRSLRTAGRLIESISRLEEGKGASRMRLIFSEQAWEDYP